MADVSTLQIAQRVKELKVFLIKNIINKKKTCFYLEKFRLKSEFRFEVIAKLV